VEEGGLKISSKKIEYIVVGKDEDIANVSLINEQKNVRRCTISNALDQIYVYVHYEIEKAKNEALRIATGFHKMLSADHVDQEKLVLPIEKHALMLSDQYLLCCFQPDHPGHKHTTKPDPPRKLKPNIMSRREEVHSFTTSVLNNKDVKNGQKNIMNMQLEIA
jgi:hypothetical protein